jgi:hypothetical protein
VTGAVRLLAVAAAVAGVALAAGCGHSGPRTNPKTLNPSMSKAFKRASAATYRMTTSRKWKGLVAYARVRCHPDGPEPKTDAGWHWSCRVLWRRRFQTHKHVATYGVSVDRLGCFQAASGDFPRRVPERVLGRDADNPLVHIRSCP